MYRVQNTGARALGQGPGQAMIENREVKPEEIDW